MSRVIVSACLLGVPCRFDGRSKPSAKVGAQVEAWRRAGVEVVAVCPETLGGLPTPRPAAHLSGGDGHAVLEGRATVRRVEDGTEVTGAFREGAGRAAERGAGATRAVLKARSPSCGVGLTQIDGERRAGDGVLAALLRRADVEVKTDEDL
jgi:uncharacterized protein YbbK (DUF523 family)